MTAVERTPAVLVHGWAGSAESWNPVAEKLDPDTWEVIAIRLPGSRGAAPGEPSIPVAAAALAGLLQDLPTPALLVGHSMGAQVTLRAHSMCPARVLGEVVIDPAYAGESISKPDMAAWADRIEHEGRAAVDGFFRSATDAMPRDVAARILTDLDDTSASVIASYLRSEYVDDDAFGLMPETAAVGAGRRRPVLSVHSTDASARRESLLPTSAGSVSQIWTGHGHYLHLEDPARFVDLLEEWRNRLAPLPSSA